MTELERMNKGLLHDFTNSKEMDDLKAATEKLLVAFNSYETSEEERAGILKKMFGTVEGHCLIKPPFRCEYGRFISIGTGSFLNYDCLILDGCPITIGRNVYVGPRTTMTTASHPLYAPIRIEHFGIHKPIVIEDGVWIGAGSIILPGAVIGKNTVIGAGSVVTGHCQIPAGCIAFGNPCKVWRSVTKEDMEYWEDLKKEYTSTME